MSERDVSTATDEPASPTVASGAVDPPRAPRASNGKTTGSPEITPNGIPVWDPPTAPVSKPSWRDRLGIGQRVEELEAEEQADQAAVRPTTQRESSTPSGTAASSLDQGATSPRPAGGAPAAAADESGTGKSGFSRFLSTIVSRPDPVSAKDVARPAPDASGSYLNEESARETAPQPKLTPEGTPTFAPPGPGMIPVPPPGSVVAAGPVAGAAPVAATPSSTPTEWRQATPAPARPRPGRRTRKARLRISRVDPWSVMKTAFLFSIAAVIMLVVAVYVLWTVVEASGLFDSVNDIIANVVSTPGDTTPFRMQEYLNTQKVMGVTALLACVDVVIFTALATLASFLYNLAATVLGGLEVTLAED